MRRPTPRIMAIATLIAAVFTTEAFVTYSSSEVGGRPAGFLVSEAEAVIGRPLTPMSYAGVARRTTRRMVYATTVYRATLPANCMTTNINGVVIYQCGSTYYQASGNQYVVVNVH